MSQELPAWLAELDGEDVQFVKRFILASGSLKELAQVYGISYPTIRSRLDRLIAKVKASEEAEPHDPFERKLRLLVAGGRVSAGLARELMKAHETSDQQRPPQSQKATKS